LKVEARAKEQETRQLQYAVGIVVESPERSEATDSPGWRQRPFERNEKQKPGSYLLITTLPNQTSPNFLMLIYNYRYKLTFIKYLDGA